MKILVVEDEPKLAEYLRRALTESNYIVDVAHSGTDGRYLATEGHYDLVLLDCPPSLDELTRNGLAAADSALVVTEPGFFALQGATRALRAVEAARTSVNLRLRPAGVLVNRVRGNLSEHRYRIGVDSNLTFLDAQRQLFSAQQALITDRLAQLTSAVNLYKALGGGWNAQTAQNEPLKEEAPKMKLF